MEPTIADKIVTYDFAPFDGRRHEVKCSEFGRRIVDRLLIKLEDNATPSTSPSTAPPARLGYSLLLPASPRSDARSRYSDSAPSTEIEPAMKSLEGVV